MDVSLATDVVESHVRAKVIVLLAILPNNKNDTAVLDKHNT